ncbi:MAG: hypothetical protein M1829_000879 [Trizodia sp. TS-e1964]|nr:MAG: hypothetical protein M1829_000879 [Trizodia sp. TS-e1964]
MYLPCCFLQLLLLASCALAFYPYSLPQPKASSDSDPAANVKRSPLYIWHNEQFDAKDSPVVPTLGIRKLLPKSNVHPISQTIHEANHITRKYRARGIPGPEVDEERAFTNSQRGIKQRASSIKGSNGFEIVLSKPPAQANSAAINQDGVDFSYFSTVQFGSSGKPLYMLIDSGASATWVMGSECVAPSCVAHTRYGKADSSTLTISSTSWNVTYGTGQVGGYVANDTVSFAKSTFDLQFGYAKDVSDDFQNYPFDGILGFGLPRPNSANMPTIMETLSAKKIFKANIIGINLDRSSDDSNDGQITFGDFDKSKFIGDIAYLKATSSNGLWELPIVDAGVDNRPCNFTGKSAIIDTGTSFMLLPLDDAKKLHSQIPNVQLNGEVFTLPCSSTQILQIVYTGITIEIPPKDYVGKNIGGELCLSNIIGRQTFGVNQWLLGDTFLKNAYMVCDYDQIRIGFAKKVDPKSSVLAATMSATPVLTSSGQSISSSSFSLTVGQKPVSSLNISPNHPISFYLNNLKGHSTQHDPYDHS